MKTYVVFLLGMIFSISVLGQDQSRKLSEIKVTPPKFTGVEGVVKIETEKQTTAINNYLASIFQYPNGNVYPHEGTVVVQFVVTPEGEVTDFKVVNSVSPKIDKEFIRVIRSTNGMWRPGNNNKQAVAMEKELAMQVKTSETEHWAVKRDFTEEAKVHYAKGAIKFIDKENPKKALKSFDTGIRLYPYDKSLYYIRGLCRYELGNTKGARQDWNRLKALGGMDCDSLYFAEDVKHLKGYKELLSMFVEE